MTLKEQDHSTATAYECTECGELDEEHGGPLYECICGEVFNRQGSHSDNHQCPTCHLCCMKLTEQSCLQCGVAEVVEKQVFLCTCHHVYHTID